MESLKHYSIEELRAELSRREYEAFENKARNLLAKLRTDLIDRRVVDLTTDGNPWAGSYTVKFVVKK